MPKVLDYGREVSEFRFQTHYSVRIRANTRKKGINLITPYTNALDSTPAVLLQGWFDTK